MVMGMETGQAPNTQSGEREVGQRRSVNWHCRAVWHKFRVCGPAVWVEDPDRLELIISNINPRGVCKAKIEPIRFVASVGNDTEAEVKLGYVRKKKRVVVVVTWSRDGKIHTVRKYPKDGDNLVKWLIKTLSSVFGISVRVSERDKAKNDLEPIRWAFNYMVQIAYYKSFCASGKWRQVEPVELKSISELKERATFRKIVRVCFKNASRGNVHKCVGYLIFVPRGDRVLVFYIDGVMNAVFEEDVIRIEAAALPNRIAIVRDPIQGNDYVVAFMGDKFVDAIPLDETDNKAVARRLTSKPGLFIMEKYDDVIIPRLRDYLSQTRFFLIPITIGIWPGYGLIDPYGAIDTSDNGPAPIVDAVKWIDAHYHVNNKQAKAVLVYALAKFFTPAIKRVKKQFVDPVIINLGPGGVGISTLSRELIVRGLMGIEPDDTRYLPLIAGSVKSEPQYRNLTDINALLLILDEQKLTDIINNKAVIHSSAVGVNIMGIHAARYGRGIGAAFLSLRGVIINTNAKKDEILRVLGNEETLYTYIRRLRFIPWDGGVQALNEGASAAANPPNLKQVIGFLVRLMNKHWAELSKVGTFDELVHLLLDLIRREANGNEDVIKAVNELEEAIKAIEEAERAERAGLFTSENDIITFISNLKKITIVHKRTADLPNMLLTLLELDRSYGVAFTVDTRVDGGEVKAGVEDALRAVGVIRSSYNTVSNNSSTTGAAYLEDVANEPGSWGEVARRILGMLNSGVVRVSIENGSSLIGGRRDTVLGKKPSKLKSLGGREGFSFRIDELISNIVRANVAGEGDEVVDNEQTG
jgi:hypothetical protein